MPKATTPISRSLSSALTRILDSVTRGYTRYATGSVQASKALKLAQKFHDLYGIGCTPAQRIMRRQHGRASALLVLLWHEDAERVSWCLMATSGTGLEAEKDMKDALAEKLVFEDYQLVRRAKDGRTTWTFKRTKAAMAAWVALVRDQAQKHHMGAVRDTLQRAANQPGFQGVREQTFTLIELARSLGFTGEAPHVYYMQKMTHGEKYELNSNHALPPY